MAKDENKKIKILDDVMGTTSGLEKDLHYYRKGETYEVGDDLMNERLAENLLAGGLAEESASRPSKVKKVVDPDQKEKEKREWKEKQEKDLEKKAIEPKENK